MNAKTLAHILDYCDRGSEVQSSTDIMADQCGLVIAFVDQYGTVNLYGALDDEVDVPARSSVFEFLVDSKGVAAQHPPIKPTDAELNDYLHRKAVARPIKVIHEPAAEWPYRFETEIPHETFQTIANGDESYCLGIVFKKEELV